MYTNSLINGYDDDILAYKKYKNKLKHLLRIAEKLHYKDILNMCKRNLSKTWKILNGIINRNKIQKKATKFKIDGKITTDNNEIAHKFNTFFQNIGPNLAGKIPNHVKSPMAFVNGTYSDSMFMKPVSDTELLNIIQNLRNSSVGWDDIGGKIIKHTKHIILPCLKHLCNI